MRIWTPGFLRAAKLEYSGRDGGEMLAKGQRPPVEFTRPEIADILIASMRT